MFTPFCRVAARKINDLGYSAFVTGEEAQDIVAALAKVKPEIKAFLLDYSNRLIR